jgi:epoxide hydrolase-like predicted phosphatase
VTNREGSPYRALLVDYGGVLTTSVTTSFAMFCVSTGVDPARLKALLGAAYAGRPAQEDPAADAGPGLVEALETGAMPTEEFDRRLAAVLSEGLDPPLDPSNLTARMLGGIRPDERMIAAVRRARSAGIRTGLISNTWNLEASPSASLDLFDVRVLSGEEGVRKPDPEIYRRAARKLGVDPAECVFVDDLPSNVEGARAVGMAGVLHRDAAITIPKLESLLGVKLAGA